MKSHNNKNTRKKCEVYSKLTIETPKRRHWPCFGVFTLNHEQANVCWGRLFFVSKHSKMLFLSKYKDSRMFQLLILLPWTGFYTMRYVGIHNNRILVNNKVQKQYNSSTKKSKDVSLWLNYLIDNRTSITAFLEVQISWRKRGERTSCTTHHYFHSLNNTDSVTVWLPLRDKLNTQSPVKVELSINSANKCLAPFQVNVPFLCYTFYTWKHEETFSFLVFSRVTERDLWLTT